MNLETKSSSEEKAANSLREVRLVSHSSSGPIVSEINLDRPGLQA